MALAKVIATQYGVNAAYWKIANKAEDFIAGTVRVQMAGYVSAEARQGGSAPLVAAAVDVTGDNYTADLDRAGLYAAIKTLPAWADATDC